MSSIWVNKFTTITTRGTGERGGF